MRFQAAEGSEVARVMIKGMFNMTHNWAAETPNISAALLADSHSLALQRGFAILCLAYGKDPDFFAFYRTMSAYEQGLKSNDTRFLLRPDSDFFKYFGSASGHPQTAAPPAAAGAAAAAPK